MARESAKRFIASTKPRSNESGDSHDDSYHFIHMGGSSSSDDPTKVSDETRATIRRRVMNNYVQKRRRKRADEKKQHGVLGLDLVQTIDGADPFDVFPIRLEPYMIDLLKYCKLTFYTICHPSPSNMALVFIDMTTVWRSYYTIESRASINPITDYWLPIAFHDDALLHLLIGCSFSHSYRSGYPQKHSIWFMHMNKALTIVRNRLESSQLMTDETIAVVATLAFVEVCSSLRLTYIYIYLMINSSRKAEGHFRIG